MTANCYLLYGGAEKDIGGILAEVSPRPLRTPLLNLFIRVSKREPVRIRVRDILLPLTNTPTPSTSTIYYLLHPATYPRYYRDNEHYVRFLSGSWDYLPA